jgi:hypothetical protein
MMTAAQPATQQPPAQPAANPLDQLKDIHLPDQIEQFQLAVGWWVLIALTVILVVYLILRWQKKRKALFLLVPANIELDKLAQSKADNKAMAELSALLKRVCLLYYPLHQVAALSGESWTQFINQQVGQEVFSKSQQQIFSQLTYQANSQVEPTLWSEVINSSRIAIDSIIRQGVKQQLNKKSKKGSR